MDQIELTKCDSHFYQTLGIELLKMIRGTDSQIQLSTQLGYKFNQVGKWESGFTSFSWQDFIKVCELKKIPWQKNTQSLFGFTENLIHEPHNILNDLKNFYGFRSIDELSQLLNKSRSTVSRLQRGEVKIDLSDVLKLIDIRPLTLTRWISLFVKAEDLNIYKNRAESDFHKMNGIMSIPWAGLVNAALHLEEAPKNSFNLAWISKKTSLSKEEVQIALQTLSSAGIIYIKNDHYVSTMKSLSFLRAPELRPLTHFLNKKIYEAYSPEKSIPANFHRPSMTSIRVYPISSEASQKITESLISFHNQISEILKNDNAPKDHVRAILINSLDLEILSQNETPISNIEK